VGVILCNPLGHEALSAHRTYRHLAERLAEAGFDALRFDYAGTGDSSGSMEQPGRLRAFIDGVHAAADELRRQRQVTEIALFGVRFGAAIAALAAAERDDVSDLIAWAPTVSGAVYVRELRALRMLMPKLVPPPRADGSEEILGFLFQKETLAELGQIDLLKAGKAPARRALVLTRNPQATPEETNFAERLKADGADTKLSASQGYGRMMRDTYQSEVPEPLLEEIVAWLREGKSAAARDAGAALPSPATLHTGEVRETPLRFGDGERLFGVISEPEKGPSNRAAVCLLNVGSNPHIGPHRMYVDLARRLAAKGRLCLRFDISGLGESGPLPGKAENRLYDIDTIEDVRAALSMLEEKRGAKRFVLLGLCSGAYLAYQAALRDPRVAGEVLLNSFAFEWKEGDPVEPTGRKTYPSARYYWRAALDKDAWRRAFKGEVDLRGIGAVLLERTRARLAAALRPSPTPVERSFRELGKRGVRSLLVSTFNDGGLDMIAEHVGADASRMKDCETFRLEVVDAAVDHVFTSVEARERLFARLEQWLDAHFP
jgi:alpha-beta hydrolase superfamily lysophospholipase